MANIPAYIQKTLKMKPEVEKIFDDLDKWLDHCRFNLIPFNPADLYRSQEYRNFSRYNGGGERRTGYQGKNPRPQYNNEHRSMEGPCTFPT
jgi:hypothetical protein